jgi:hypothetical protein
MEGRKTMVEFDKDLARTGLKVDDYAKLHRGKWRVSRWLRMERLSLMSVADRCCSD